MAKDEKRIYVYLSLEDQCDILVGVLYVLFIKGKEQFSFEYDEEFLSNDFYRGIMLDPCLSFYKGRQYPSNDSVLFGIFMDSCPDRFGRLLIKRKEALLAAKEGRKPRKLYESDYLLNVSDFTRMGSIRFSLDKGKSFVSSEKEMPTPPLASLRTLEHASLALENEKNRNIEKWLRIMLYPGSSLGGARPKANVIDSNNELWIAKFPSRHDEYDYGLWEKITHDLAIQCGINVPQADLKIFSNYGHTYLVKRFDRIKEKRRHFSSAMSLLNHVDGDGGSYLEIVSFIRENGSNPKKDLEELFRRVAFSIAVSNTDDHLRNHGFILEKDGWALSPMYDCNPNLYGDFLSLTIDDVSSLLDFETLLSTANYYLISRKDAEEIVIRIKRIVSQNRKEIAICNGANKESIEMFAPIFERNNS